MLFQTASIFTCLALKGLFEILIFTLFKIRFCTVDFFSSVVAYSAKDFLALQPTALKFFQCRSPQRLKNSISERVFKALQPTALKIFQRCSLQRLKLLSVVAFSAKDFLALQPTALKILQRCSLQRLKFFFAGPEMPATTGTHKDLRLLFFLLQTPRLPASVSLGVADSPYRRVGESLFVSHQWCALFY